MSGARLILDFHGLEVPKRALFQALTTLAPYLEDADDFAFLPEAHPMPADGQPWLDIRLEGAPGPEEIAVAQVMCTLMAQALPAGTRIAIPDF
ncbi:hypothetical protein [Pseudooceanicola sp. 200-1SW]|uniref:hypothetical protein n=1 Tax=Pseudooceanicola sp. 200-1SW TaxID=3425949 RepID=UPI003D7FF617